MTTKSSNPDLGAVECDGCGGFAAVRQQKTGRKLLYLHCKNCGMDKRSGEKLQAKWRKAIGEQPPEITAFKSESVPSAQNATVLNNEWQPREVREEIERINNEAKTQKNDSGANDSGTNTERNSESKPRITSEQNGISTGNGGAANGLAFFAFGAFAGLAAIAGLRR